MPRAVMVLVATVALTSCLGQRVSVLPAASPAPAAPQATCDDAPVLGRIAFTDADGRCVPETVLELRSCALDQPEVVVRWDGSDRERRYLGGSYRVGVRDVPVDAKAIGTSPDGLVVYGKEGEPGLVWVQDALSVSRWLALPEGIPWEGRDPSVFFIGDSITDGASTYIAAALPGWTTGFDAEVGRSSSGGVAPAAAQGQALPSPDAVVVELGTNDIVPESFRQNAKEILDPLQAIPLVMWQTVHGPEAMTAIPEINATIRDLVSRYPNTTIADWNGYVSDGMLVSDGVHPLGEHENAMALLVAPLLDDWRAAVEGRGATACLS
jgi:lysophospholipase L1-like esterase